MDHGTASAIVAIQQTMAAYTHAADAAELDAAAVFAPEAELQIGETVFRGLDAIQQVYDARKPQGRADLAANVRARHFVTSSQIEMTGARNAEGCSYFQLVRCGTIEQTGFYRDRFVLHGETWLIARRHIDVQWRR